MTAPLPTVPEDVRVATAAEEAWSRRVAFRRQKWHSLRGRHRLTALDEFVGMLEQRNLAGRVALTDELRDGLRRLETAVGIPVPVKALGARDTATLHTVLVDWREDVLDALFPNRPRISEDVDAA
ncbi:MAG: hypothetical protein M3R48_09495 [Candidatus Dormibacteraeota bacterium]|nr:hypothetical protein [Candidatus Dormibacteraeota bacterium]